MGALKTSKPVHTSAAHAPMDSSIYGRLGSVGLHDILQLLGMTSRTATVSIHAEDREGKIFVRDGIVLHATAGDVSGESALLRLVNWDGAEFAIADGIEEPVTPTISKNVDAVLLDVFTRLDESKRSGIPVFTPFPSLDKIDVSTLENKVRSARVKPPLPRRRSYGKLVGALVVAGLALVSGTVFMTVQTLAVDADGLPAFDADPLSRSDTAATYDGVADEVLRAASAGSRIDTMELLASHGVSLAAPVTEPVAGDEVVREAEPETVPVETSGQLLVMVEPWARISVDGRDIGETPLPKFELASGEHELVLTNPGFVGVIRDTIRIEPGEAYSASYSFHRTGSLRILITPWADVYVDGQHVGQTPMDELQIPAGRHTVFLRHPSLGEKKEDIEVRPNESIVLKVEMQ